MRRQILSRSLLTVAAAGSILAMTGGYAHADSDAQGASNESRHSADDHSSDAYSSAEVHSSGAAAEGSAQGSPGVLSGNTVEVPVDAPVNICGNSVDAVGLLNSVSGNSCANGEAPTVPVMPRPQHAKPPVPAVRTPAVPVTTEVPLVRLADTGASSAAVGTAAGAGVALLLGGALVYRRSGRAARIRRTYS